MLKRIVTLLLAVLAWTAVTNAQTGTLPRSTPWQQGVEPQAVTRFLDSLQAMRGTQIHHVMVLRHGQVIAELHPTPFRAQDLHTLYSMSKAFVSMAVGLAIDQGKMRLDDHVINFFPDKMPAHISPNLANMTVRDLLVMASGIAPDEQLRVTTTDWTRAWLARPVATPGQRFRYDSMCTFMLSAMVQRATGHTVLDLLKQQVFTPMGITTVDWEQSPDSINTGGWGLRLQAESQAKFGLLLLNHGQWNGQQLIPAKWIELASSKQIDNGKPTPTPTDDNSGYGFQLWRNCWPESYRADGAKGQFIYVMPREDMVVVINGMSNYGREERECIWQQLMPGVLPSGEASKKGMKRLLSMEQKASLPLPKGKQKSKKVKFSPADKMILAWDGMNHLMEIDNQPDGTLRLTYSHTLQATPVDPDVDPFDVPTGYKRWTYRTSNDKPPYSIRPQNRLNHMDYGFTTAAAYAWSNDGLTLTVRVYHVDFISKRTITVHFSPDERGVSRKAQITITHDYDHKHPIHITANVMIGQND